MLLKVVDEYNDDGHLIYSTSYIGAFARGKTREEAVRKLPREIIQYCWWSGEALDNANFDVLVVQEKLSGLKICDADTDVIFETEILPLSIDEYRHLKGLVLKSAQDFLQLYCSIPDKYGTVLTPRNTFYGAVPVTACEMYEHTKGVNNYYFGEINVEISNEPDIFVCRKLGFDELEKQDGYLNNVVFDGSYGEKWSLRKVMRRFIWHDRIHARAMYRMATKLCSECNISNPFHFAL